MTTSSSLHPFLRRTALATLVGVSLSSLMTGCALTHMSIQNSDQSSTPTTNTPPAATPLPKPETSSSASLPATAAATPPLPFSTPSSAPEHIGGVTIEDPYRFLEQLSQPETQHWMKSQHDTSRHYLAELIQADKKKKTSADSISSTSTDISPLLDANSNTIQRVGTHLFYVHAREQQPKVLYIRENIENKNERTLINISHLKNIPTQSAIESFRVSPNGRWIALVISTPEANGQSSNRQIIVADAENGKVMLRPITMVEPTPFLTWRPDSEAIFYLQHNESGATHVVMRLLSGEHAGTTTPVFGPQLGLDTPIQSDERVGIITSPVSPYTLAIVQSPKGLRIFSALAPQLSGSSTTPIQTEGGITTTPEMHLTWYPLIGLQDKIVSFDLRGDWFYAITRRQQPNGELVRLRLSEPRWEEADLLIPADPKQILNQLSVAQDNLYVEKREDGYSHLIKLPYNARYQNTGELQPLADRSPAPSTTTTPALPTPAKQAKVAPTQPEKVNSTTEATNTTSTTEPEKTSSFAVPSTATSTEPPSAKKHHEKHKHNSHIRYIRVREVITSPEEVAAPEHPTSTRKHTKNKTKPSKKEGKKTHGASTAAQEKSTKQSESKHTKHHSAKTEETTAPSKHLKKGKTTSKTAHTKAGKSSKHHTHNAVASKHTVLRKHVRYRIVREVVAEAPSEATEKRRARIRSRVIRLSLPSTTPNIQDIKLPVDGIIQQLIADPLQSGILARMNDWTRPLEIVHVDGQHPPHLIEGAALQGHDKKNDAHDEEEISFPTQTARLLVPENDHQNAAMLPVTLISREGVNPANSKKPLLLILDHPGQGFAAPTFRPDVLLWLKKGGVVALANLFPQGLKEDEWLDSTQHLLDTLYVDRLENIVDYLYGEKIAAPNQLVAIGDGVNANLLGNVLAKHPDHFAGMVLQGGVYDTIHWEFTPQLKTSLSGTTLEYHLNAKQEDHFKRLWAVSSYYHLKEKIHYPGVLVLGNTDRQLVIQAAKLTARLQAANPDNHAYFYSAARPLSDETRLLFLWSQIPDDSK